MADDRDTTPTPDLPAKPAATDDEKVRGGWKPVAPSPSGPIPVPYPNLPK